MAPLQRSYVALHARNRCILLATLYFYLHVDARAKSCLVADAHQATLAVLNSYSVYGAGCIAGGASPYWFSLPRRLDTLVSRSFYFTSEICLYALCHDGPMPSGLVSSHYTQRGNCQESGANQQPDAVYLLQDAQTTSDDAVLFCRHALPGLVSISDMVYLMGSAGWKRSRWQTFKENSAVLNLEGFRQARHNV